MVKPKTEGRAGVEEGRRRLQGWGRPVSCGRGLMS